MDKSWDRDTLRFCLFVPDTEHVLKFILISHNDKPLTSFIHTVLVLDSH